MPINELYYLDINRKKELNINSQQNADGITIEQEEKSINDINEIQDINDYEFLTSITYLNPNKVSAKGTYIDTPNITDTNIYYYVYQDDGDDGIYQITQNYPAVCLDVLINHKDNI